MFIEVDQYMSIIELMLLVLTETPHLVTFHVSGYAEVAPPVIDRLPTVEAAVAGSKGENR